MSNKTPPATRYCGAATRAHVRILTGDTLSPFIDQALGLRASRMIVVSPWLGGPSGHSAGQIRRLLEHARRHSAVFELVTRRDEWNRNPELLSAVAEYESGNVTVQDLLHAKLYFCESKGGTAVLLVGSANLTDNSKNLAEVGALIGGFGRTPLARQMRQIPRHLAPAVGRRRPK